MSISNRTEARVTFAPDLDDFDHPDLGSDRIEDLDTKWSELAEWNWGENSENRRIMIEKFWSKIRDSKLEDSVKILIGKT